MWPQILQLGVFDGFMGYEGKRGLGRGKEWAKKVYHADIAKIRLFKKRPLSTFAWQRGRTDMFGENTVNMVRFLLKFGMVRPDGNLLLINQLF